jgi:protein phosphatase
MKYLWAVASHTGRVRSNNQDTPFPATSGSADEGPVLVGVADGMGGAAGGEVASSVAMSTATKAEGEPASRIQAANAAVFEESRRRPELSGMGTTMTLVELDDGGRGLFGHVGDSRAYLLRDGEITQLTDDHTIVAEWVSLGAITPEDAKTHPRRGMLTRSVGVAAHVEADVFTHDFELGDRLILCSDGLNGMIDDDTILTTGGSGTPEAAAWALVEAANEAGGHDNITVVVVDIGS